MVSAIIKDLFLIIIVLPGYWAWRALFRLFMSKCPIGCVLNMPINHYYHPCDECIVLITQWFNSSGLNFVTIQFSTFKEIENHYYDHPVSKSKWHNQHCFVLCMPRWRAWWAWWGLIRAVWSCMMSVAKMSQ